MKVVKFGGSSLSNTDKILHAKNIIEQDKGRRFVVVSAPGKDENFRQKITDLLIEGHAEMCHKQNLDIKDNLPEPSAVRTGLFHVKSVEASKSISAAIARFEWLAEGLKIDISREIERLREELEINKCTRDFVVSRGEYFMALIFARVMNYKFVDAAKYIVINNRGRVDEAETKRRLETLRKDIERQGIVMGGFYGTSLNGGVKTFDRGGSDYTGAVVAALKGATVYENFTDTHGVQTADPTIVCDTLPIPRLDYGTLHKLATAGASVIYPDCLPLLKRYGVPLVIDNTANPGKRFTTISCQRSCEAFFSITYQLKQNINKHTADILCVFSKIDIELDALKNALDGHEVYLTNFAKGEVRLIASAGELGDVVGKLHGLMLNK